MFFGCFDNLGDVFGLLDIAGVEAHLINALIHGHQRQPIIEVNIGDQRDW